MYILLEEGDVIRDDDEPLIGITCGGSRGGWRSSWGTEGLGAGRVFNSVRHPPYRRKLSAAAVKALRELGEI